MINLLLVEDHPILRVGLKVVIEQTLNALIRKEAADGRDAIRLVEEQSLDLVIMDINMPGMNGLEAAKIIKQRRPQQKILIYSAVEDNNMIADAIKTGIEGYLFKSDDANELKVGIETVIKGDNYLSRKISTHFIPFLAERAHVQQKKDDSCELSAREKEILSLILEGNTNKKIAKMLSLSYRTVDTHRFNLMKKIGCSNMASLFQYAIEKKLV